MVVMQQLVMEVREMVLLVLAETRRVILAMVMLVVMTVEGEEVMRAVEVGMVLVWEAVVAQAMLSVLQSALMPA